MNPEISGSISATTKSAFYNKVFSLFGLAILVTGAGVYAGFNYFFDYFAANPMLMFGVFIVELILIFTSRMWSKTEGLNYLLFAFFTFLSGLTLVPLLGIYILEFNGFDIIYRAMFASTAVFLAAGLVGRSIQRPLTGLAGFLFMALIGMIIVGLLGIFFPWGSTGEMIFSGLGVIIFSLYAVVDINMLRHYPDDEYIHAAMALYLDFFNLFIYILRLIGVFNRE